MERESKRKATAPPPADLDTPRSSKRQRMQSGTSNDETVESTTELGNKFLDTIKATRDKTGRFIATDFLTLPDKSVPGYYETIRMPLALDTIESKIKAGSYANMSQLESDLKRMVANAKQFNDKSSVIYSDAEKVRKAASNFMVKWNPAYKNPNYIAVPTPLPEENTPDPVVPTGAERSTRPTSASSRPRSVVADARPPPEPERDADAEHEPESAQADDGADAEGEDEEQAAKFKGLSFQEAQELIMQDLIDYTEDDLQIFIPFINLPSRTLKEYYDTIKNPVSLKSIQKLVKGIYGRNPPTGVSDFKTWEAFENQASLIWKNCITFNEDGSEIVDLAHEFEELFKRMVAEAKKHVPGPPSTKLKLNMGLSAPPKQSIKLKFGPRSSAASTPGPSTPGLDASTPGAAHDDPTAANGVNGAGAVTKNPFTGSGAAIPPLGGQSRRASAASPPRPINGVKNENASQSPAPATLSNLPPPTARNLSGSPHPQSLPVYHPPPPQLAPVEGPPPGLIDSLDRPVGQKQLDYVLPSVQIATHPALPLVKPFSVKIPASTKSLHQSVAFSLPASHYYLHITPDIPVGATHRPYRLFVTVNGTRLSEQLKAGYERDKCRPLFEARLDRGQVHKIEVEVLAAKANAKTGRDLQWEKITCLAHIMRN